MGINFSNKRLSVTKVRVTKLSPAKKLTSQNRKFLIQQGYKIVHHNE